MAVTSVAFAAAGLESNFLDFAAVASSELGLAAHTATVPGLFVGLVGYSLATAGYLAGPELVAVADLEGSVCIVQPVVAVAAGPLASAAEVVVALAVDQDRYLGLAAVAELERLAHTALAVVASVDYLVALVLVAVVT